MPKIMMVSPFSKDDPRLAYTQRVFGGEGVVVAGIGRAPKFLRTPGDGAYIMEGIVEQVKVAEKEGFDAAIIGGFSDAGLDAAREKVSIPVIGPGQASLALANLLGHKFSIIAPARCWVPVAEHLVLANGLMSKLASVRVYTCNIAQMDPKSISDLECGLEPTNDKDAQMAVDASIWDTIAAVDQDGASVVIFSALGQSWMLDKARVALGEKGYSLPLIDPGQTAVEMAKLVCNLKLSHSRATFV